MIGKDRDGGYAEYICLPERNAFALPDEIPFAHAAVMMCSYATALHALRKARFTEGESVAIFGAGGLGTAAIGLSTALGASSVIAVDNNSAKIRAARSMGAIGIDASDADVVAAVMESTGGQGVDVALELVGLPITSEQAVKSLGVQGRAAMVGLTNAPTPVNTYRDLIGKECEIIGVSDHLPEEIDELISLVQQRRLDIAPAISRSVALDEKAVNKVFEELDSYSGAAIRTVISLE
jgi:propanol-preferring alcohol dehydrogenase